MHVFRLRFMAKLLSRGGLKGRWSREYRTVVPGQLVLSNGTQASCEKSHMACRDHIQSGRGSISGRTAQVAVTPWRRDPIRTVSRSDFGKGASLTRVWTLGVIQTQSQANAMAGSKGGVPTNPGGALTRSVSFEVALFRVLPQGGETRKPRPQAWGQVKPLPKAPTGRDSLIRAGGLK